MTNQNQTTDLSALQEFAIVLLYVDIKETELPMFASHPFTNTWFGTVLENGSMVSVDLREAEGKRKWRAFMKQWIQKSDLRHLLQMLNPSYLLYFLVHVKDHLSSEDLGEALRLNWNRVESISVDPNVTGQELVELFKRASKETLMQEEAREMYQALPDEVTLYRGVTSYNKAKKKALSWTTDRTVAEWFANRFSTDTGEVWEISVPKERILSYRGDQQEHVVIVDLYGWKGELTIEKI